MKCKVRIMVDSLYPKRHLDKVFEYLVKKIRGLSCDLYFQAGNVKRMGNMETFKLDRYCFLCALISDYAGSLKCY